MYEGDLGSAIKGVEIWKDFSIKKSLIKLRHAENSLL